MKLNLGCGNDKRKDYINCDSSPLVNPCKIVDLEKPLPFKDNTVEEILLNHVLEHIRNFKELIHELHRISKNGAILKIKTPFYSAWGQFNDPTHVRFFTPYTFNYFRKSNYSHEVGCSEDMFNMKKVHLYFGIGILSKLNFLFDPILNLSHKFYCRFFAWIFPCSEIYYELEVIKTLSKQNTPQVKE